MGAFGGPHCPINQIFENAHDHLTFQEMVDIYLETMPGAISEYFRIFTDAAFFVGRYERLRYDQCTVFCHLGMPYKRRYVFGSPVVNPTDAEKKEKHPWASDNAYREGQWEAVCEAESDFVKEFYHG